MALTKINTDALSDNAVTLAKMASGTDGEILTYDASGNPTSVSVGTDGQVLTSTGAGSPPAFEAAAAGGKVLQVVQDVNKYQHSSAGVQDTYYAMLESSGVDWTPSISISANSKIIVDFLISVSTGSTDPFQLVLLEKKIDAGSWSSVDVGTANGSRIQSTIGFRYRAENGYGIQQQYIRYLYDPAQGSTSTVQFRVRARQGANTTRPWYYNYATANVSEAGTFLSTCTLTEVGQ